MTWWSWMILGAVILGAELFAIDAQFYLVFPGISVAIIILLKTAFVIPQQSGYVIERLGKYSRTLKAGLHILIPFIERVAYKHSLKEQTADIAEQVCITKDNVQVGVAGVLYPQVLDPGRASYGIGNYLFAISQLAQTTLRSEIGKIAKTGNTSVVPANPFDLTSRMALATDIVKGKSGDVRTAP